MADTKARQRTGGSAPATAIEWPLLDGLSCPSCAGRLAASRPGPSRFDARQHGAPALDAIQLACSSCGHRWPVRHQTPAFVPHGGAPPAGSEALLSTADGDNWEGFRAQLRRVDAALHGEVFDAGRDDWRFLLAIPAGARALVVGCGWGRLAASLAEVCGRVYAVDGREACARFTNARAAAEVRPNLLALAAGVETLPFAPESFHLVVVQEPGMLNVRGDPRCLRTEVVRLRRLLAPDGILAIRCTPGGLKDARATGVGAWHRLARQSGFACARTLEFLPSGAWATDLGCARGDAVLAGAHAAHAIVRGESTGRWRALAQRAAAVVEGSRGRPATEPERWLIVGRTQVPTPPVVEHAGLPGQAWGILRDAPGEAAEGRARFVAFSPDAARPRFRVDVARDAAGVHAVEQEHLVLQRLHEVLSPAMRCTIAEPVRRFQVHGRVAAARSYLAGRPLAERVLAAPPRRRAEVAADVLEGAAMWLGALHRQTARYVEVTPDVLDRVVSSGIRRAVDACPPGSRAGQLFSRLLDDCQGLLGERLPLVCEHGALSARNVLRDRQVVQATEWEAARFDGPPLMDLFRLAHSLAFLLLEDQGPLAGPGVLKIAYGGQGVFSRRVGLCVEAYCARLAMPTGWGSLLLPGLLLREAERQARQPHPGAEPAWMPAGVRYLQRPADFPTVLGLPPRPEPPRGGGRA